MYITTITHHQTTKEQKKKDFFFFSPFPNPIYLDHRSEAETLSQPEKNTHMKNIQYSNHIIFIFMLLGLHQHHLCPLVDS